jgi:ketol-acid reductoisomerase
VSQKNYSSYPKLFTTNMGMVRGCSATGKVSDAMKYAKKALPLAPDANNKKVVEDMMAQLKDGKDVSSM